MKQVEESAKWNQIVFDCRRQQLQETEPETAWHKREQRLDIRSGQLINEFYAVVAEGT